MEKKPTLFSYKGETLIILPGHLLDKNELIQRLRTIDFLAINSYYNKNDLVYIYEIALTYDNNKLKLYNKLLMLLQLIMKQFRKKSLKLLMLLMLNKKLVIVSHQDE